MPYRRQKELNHSPTRCIGGIHHLTCPSCRSSSLEMREVRVLTRQRGEQASETVTRRDETATRYSQRVELGDPLQFDCELHFWCNRCNQAHAYAFAQAPGGSIQAERVIRYEQTKS